MKNWIALFSQTGSEIYNISKILGKFPDRIITNNLDIENINQDLLREAYDRFWCVESKPSAEEYETFLTEDSIITMHGWLRVVPPSICNKFTIYNLHPAPLTRYPHLKGKDPQKRIFNEGLEYGGNTIHKCTSELDSGEILLENEVSVKSKSLDEIFSKTHNAASKLWIQFLASKISE